jgi:hypothetical protein
VPLSRATPHKGCTAHHACCILRQTCVRAVRIDNTVMSIEAGWPAFIRNTRHIGDFRRWKTQDVYQQAFDRLLRDLKAAERNAGA